MGASFVVGERGLGCGFGGLLCCCFPIQKKVFCSCDFLMRVVTKVYAYFLIRDSVAIRGAAMVDIAGMRRTFPGDWDLRSLEGAHLATAA